MQKLAILGTGDVNIANATMPAAIAEAARYFTPELCDVPGAVFPGSPGALEICNDAYLQAGQAAEQQGYAGMYINTVGDYGLAELRAVSTIPVVGSGEGSIRAARSGGRRFAIVTIWPPAMRNIYNRIIDQSGAQSDCLGIHHLSEDQDLATLDQPHNFVSEMQSCSLSAMANIRNACQQALERDGADVIILGCTCMHGTSALLQAEGLPVIEPMAAGYEYLEALVRDPGRSH